MFECGQHWVVINFIFSSNKNNTGLHHIGEKPEGTEKYWKLVWKHL